MADKIQRDLQDGEFQGSLSFPCPGCGWWHVFNVKEGREGYHHTWKWNGSLEAPTFKPSLLNRTPQPRRICHLFVREGSIQFLTDCTHDLAGKTVVMEDLQQNA